ncbi:hypothetical protein H5J25_06710 [Sphingomonas aliaeris]|uniref:Antitoxin FitA-like ribbon-helix-helix domain-containing protein n=1 Tax=Sphingomonas aliaeris TaxID=2759526 RepID=A0A974NWV7_9SPHN|nr:hypothetical protein [Sphingomonas aliaeris]QQV78348.1 hypothetical protein H5J25_06710 [Sphingomonas aliaeris]
MGQVLIRNLDDALLTEYREAAKAKGRSLEAELRDVLASARPKATMSGERFVSFSKSLRAMTPQSARGTDSTDLIRADRDER